MEVNKIYQGNALAVLKTFTDGCVDCCITSPPYFGLRDYGNINQLGLEETPELYIQKLVAVFSEVKRVLKDNGTFWCNIGDSYSGSNSTKDAAINPNSLSFNMGQKKGGTSKPIGVIKGLKPKDLIGIPWMLAFALRADGWYLRQDIIWSKPNPMPESVTDRCTKSHEYIFLLSKSPKYYYDADAIKTKSVVEGQIRRADTNKYIPTDKINGIRKDVIQPEFANKRSVWTVNTRPYKDAHFAVFPERLITDCVKAVALKTELYLTHSLDQEPLAYMQGR